MSDEKYKRNKGEPEKSIATKGAVRDGQVDYGTDRSSLRVVFESLRRLCPVLVSEGSAGSAGPHRKGRGRQILMGGTRAFCRFGGNLQPMRSPSVIRAKIDRKPICWPRGWKLRVGPCGEASIGAQVIATMKLSSALTTSCHRITNTSNSSIDSNRQ